MIMRRTATTIWELENAKLITQRPGGQIAPSKARQQGGRERGGAHRPGTLPRYGGGWCA